MKSPLNVAGQDNPGNAVPALHDRSLRFTVEDPDTFTQPFSGEVAMNASAEKIYEYACHEGNYALPGILAGARAQEQEAAAKKWP
ncbi:MAG: hypothetical protein ACREXP_07680 [Steroidobacteraceae bacterium]